MKPKNLLIVKAVLEQGLTQAQAAHKYGISRQWVHTLVNRYQTHGPQGLTPRSKAPKTTPKKTPEKTRNRIIELRLELTTNGADAGPATIAWHLEQEGFTTPAISTIRRILHQANLITPTPQKRPKNSYIRFQADLPNECWQSDITHWYLANGTRIEILDFLDDHSRYLLSITAAKAFTGTTVANHLHYLIQHHGPPMSTLTDNGLVFTTRLARFKGARGGFEKILNTYGITQKTVAPDTPKHKEKSNDSTKPSNATSKPKNTQQPSLNSNKS